MIDKPEPRRFPPPWIAEETDACFIVRDASRQALAYVYFEEEPGRRSAAKLLTRDEARRIAANQSAGVAAQAVRYQKLPAAFSGPARGIPGGPGRFGGFRILAAQAGESL
jgi:hypothetical protein